MAKSVLMRSSAPSIAVELARSSMTPSLICERFAACAAGEPWVAAAGVPGRAVPAAWVALVTGATLAAALAAFVALAAPLALLLLELFDELLHAAARTHVASSTNDPARRRKNERE